MTYVLSTHIAGTTLLQSVTDLQPILVLALGTGTPCVPRGSTFRYTSCPRYAERDPRLSFQSSHRRKLGGGVALGVALAVGDLAAVMDVVGDRFEGGGSGAATAPDGSGSGSALRTFFFFFLAFSLLARMACVLGSSALVTL